MSIFPFRIGTTSFIYRADISTNVKKLARTIDDIEIVLFDTGENDNLPDDKVLGEIGKIADKNGTSFTVHLPLRSDFGSEDKGIRNSSADLAIKIVDLMNKVDPWAYVVHLDPGDLNESNSKPGWDAWASRCGETLSKIASHAKDPGRLCVENLESFRIERLDPVLSLLPVGLCLDIGHLWVQNLDPVPFIERYGERIRVVHIHGIHKRDHSSLVHVPKRELKRVLDSLASIGFRGVATIEVFNKKDLGTSIRRIREWLGGQRKETRA